MRIIHDDGSAVELKPGGVFGLNNLFAERPVAFTAVTMEAALILHLSESDLADVMANNVEISKGLMRALASAIDEKRAPSQSARQDEVADAA